MTKIERQIIADKSDKIMSACTRSEMISISNSLSVSGRSTREYREAIADLEYQLEEAFEDMKYA